MQLNSVYSICFAIACLLLRLLLARKLPLTLFRHMVRLFYSSPRSTSSSWWLLVSSQCCSGVQMQGSVYRWSASTLATGRRNHKWTVLRPGVAGPALVQVRVSLTPHEVEVEVEVTPHEESADTSRRVRGHFTTFLMRTVLDANRSRCRSVPATRRGNPKPILACTHRKTCPQRRWEGVDCTAGTTGGSGHLYTDTFCQSAAGVLCTGNRTSGQTNQQQCHGLPKRSAAGTERDEGKSAIKKPWESCRGRVTHKGSAEYSGAGKCERGVNMAHCHSNDKVWFQAEQTGLQRCALFKIWLDARKVALTLPMLAGVLSGTCLQLSERSLAFNQA